MKPVPKIGFSEHEKKIIRNVAIYSIALCIMVVSGSWFYNSFKIKANTRIKIEKQIKTVTNFDIEAHKFAAKIHLQNGNPQKAISHLQRITAFDKKDVINHINLANAFLDAGQYQDALDSYNSIPSEELSDSLLSSICTRKGIALYYLDQKDESRNILNECINQYSESAEALCFLGQIKAAYEKDTQNVINTFENAIKLDSNYVEAWYQLARYWMQLGKYLKAREYLLHALQIDPLHAKSHARLGMIYYYLGDFEFSRISYQTAVAINPSDYNTHYNLGELYYTQLADTAKALIEFKSAIKNNADHPEANFKIGLICMKNNMIKEAIHYFENSVMKEPSNTRFLLQLAIAFERLQLKDQASITYKKILSVDDLNSIARQKLKLLGQY